MFEFSHPWLALLVPLPWLVARFLPALSVSGVALRIPFAERLDRALEQKGSFGNVLPNRQWISWGVWGLLVLALMRPQWLKPPLSRELPARDMMLLVDLSGSMQQQDFQSEGGEKVDRLTAVKEVVGDFLLEREGDRVGLIVFGNAPYLQVPFSTDLELCRQLLEETQVGMAGPRTAFGDAIGLGILQFDQSDAASKTLIALTDGNDSASQVPPVEAARVAKSKGVRIHTIAIGDPATVGEDPLDEITLKEVAETGGGNYYFAGDRASLEKIYQEIDDQETREVEVVTHRPRLDLFMWPLAAAFTLQVLGSLLLLHGDHKALKETRAQVRLKVDVRTGELELEEEA